MNEVLGLEHAVLAPFLLWTFALLSTVILINLLTARITTAFDEVQGRSAVERQILFAHLVQDYKDNRDLPPPFNMLKSLFRLMLSCAGPFIKARYLPPSSAEGYVRHVPISGGAGLEPSLTHRYRDQFVRRQRQQEDERVSSATNAKKLEALRDEVKHQFTRLHSGQHAIQSVLEAWATASEGGEGGRPLVHSDANGSAIISPDQTSSPKQIRVGRHESSPGAARAHPYATPAAECAAGSDGARRALSSQPSRVYGGSGSLPPLSLTPTPRQLAVRDAPRRRVVEVEVRDRGVHTSALTSLPAPSPPLVGSISAGRYYC